MKKLIIYLTFLLSGVLSCQQPEILTSAEQMARTLQRVVQDNNIKTAYVNLPATNSAYFNGDNSISFQGGFIGIGGSYWNLDKLIRYETYVDSTTKATILKLTFST